MIWTPRIRTGAGMIRRGSVWGAVAGCADDRGIMMKKRNWMIICTESLLLSLMMTGSSFAEGGSGITDRLLKAGNPNRFFSIPGLPVTWKLPECPSCLRLR